MMNKAVSLLSVWLAAGTLAAMVRYGGLTMFIR